MNDRELLELAAKAAGIHIEYRRSSDAYYYDDQDTGREQWCPRDDDRQAVKLAVKLRMCVSVEHDAQAAVWQGDELLAFNEPLGDDECAAVRLAVLRCAAEIGRSKP